MIINKFEKKLGNRWRNVSAELIIIEIFSLKGFKFWMEERVEWKKRDKEPNRKHDIEAYEAKMRKWNNENNVMDWRQKIKCKKVTIFKGF